jgi:oligopeptidase A
VLTYADARNVRELLYKASNARASKGDRANPGIVTQILALRREQAQLLGYANFADLVLEDRMARSAQAAREFIADLRARAEPAFERENRELVEFYRELEGPDAEPLAPWDLAYYAEKRRRRDFDFDDEQLRPYFRLERVLEGLFHCAERL